VQTMALVKDGVYGGYHLQSKSKSANRLREPPGGSLNTRQLTQPVRQFQVRRGSQYSTPAMSNSASVQTRRRITTETTTATRASARTSPVLSTISGTRNNVRKYSRTPMLPGTTNIRKLATYPTAKYAVCRP